MTSMRMLRILAMLSIDSLAGACTGDAGDDGDGGGQDTDETDRVDTADTDDITTGITGDDDDDDDDDDAPPGTLDNSTRGGPILINDAGDTIAVAKKATDDVTLLSLPDLEVRARVDVGDEPVSVSWSPDNSTLYVVNRGDGSVTQILDAGGDSPSAGATVDVGSETIQAALSPRGSFLYVTSFIDATLNVIDTSSMTLTEQIVLGGAPHGICVSNDLDDDEDDETIWVTDFFGDPAAGEDEANDTGREGRVFRVAAGDFGVQESFIAVFEDSTFPGFEDTGFHPNHLYSCIVNDDRVYVTAVGASPEAREGTTDFHQNVQGMVAAIDTETGQEDTDRSVNLNTLAGALDGPKRFVAIPMDIAFAPQQRFRLRGLDREQRDLLDRLGGFTADRWLSLGRELLAHGAVAHGRDDQGDHRVCLQRSRPIDHGHRPRQAGDGGASDRVRAAAGHGRGDLGASRSAVVQHGPRPLVRQRVGLVPGVSPRGSHRQHHVGVPGRSAPVRRSVRHLQRGRLGQCRRADRFRRGRRGRQPREQVQHRLVAGGRPDRSHARGLGRHRELRDDDPCPEGRHGLRRRSDGGSRGVRGGGLPELSRRSAVDAVGALLHPAHRPGCATAIARVAGYQQHRSAAGPGGRHRPGRDVRAAGGPYLHNGPAESLEDLLDPDGEFTTHLRAGDQVFSPSDQQLADLIAFVRSIDDDTELIDVPSDQRFCPDGLTFP